MEKFPINKEEYVEGRLDAAIKLAENAFSGERPLPPNKIRHLKEWLLKYYDFAEANGEKDVKTKEGRVTELTLWLDTIDVDALEDKLRNPEQE